MTYKVEICDTIQTPLRSVPKGWQTLKKGNFYNKNKNINSWCQGVSRGLTCKKSYKTGKNQALLISSVDKKQWSVLQLSQKWNLLKNIFGENSSQFWAFDSNTNVKTNKNMEKSCLKTLS